MKELIALLSTVDGRIEQTEAKLARLKARKKELTAELKDARKAAEAELAEAKKAGA